ncbi:hypothetical protein PA01_12650 [Azoarcus sp. PA01]|nr:hypothetical protein PA01_12650 [Azoarcus sp. PA01]
MKHGTCIHYTGMNTGADYKTRCCAAGINYFEAFNGRQSGIFLRMPCVEAIEKPEGRPGTRLRPGEKTVLVPVDRRGEAALPCALRQEPTAEQVEQDRIESEAAFGRAMAAISVAAKWRVTPKPEHDRNEVIECPCCRGKLHLFQSARNGHVHGHCETEQCVRWYE